jgi:hypothetical protein
MAVIRTRRRILIAALAVVGIPVVWWAMLPEVDQRFVGRWNVVGYSTPQVWTFRADGTLDVDGRESGAWHVKGNNLCFGESDIARLTRLWREVVGRQPYYRPRPNEHRILAVEKDVIQMHCVRSYSLERQQIDHTK